MPGRRRGRELNPGESLTAYLGSKVRMHRERLDMSQSELGDHSGYTGDQISKIERGDRVPSLSACKAFDELFGTGEFFQELQPHAKRESVPQWIQALAEYERDAKTIMVFHPLVIHALVQTEEYADAVAATTQQGAPKDATVAARMERQEVLNGDDPPWVVILLNELALRNMVGGPEIMKMQLARLLVDMERPNVTIQVIPQGIFLSAFSVLTFSSGRDVAYAEVAVSPGQFYDDRRRLDAFKVLFDQIRSQALPVGASASLIREIMESI